MVNKTREALAEYLAGISAELATKMPSADLSRVYNYVGVIAGTCPLPLSTPDRAVAKGMYFPGLRSGPMFDAEWAGASVLERNWEIIKREFWANAGADRALTEEITLVGKENAEIRDKYIHIYLVKRFRWIHGAKNIFPMTSALLSKMRIGTEALFSRLPPGGTILRHTDRANYVVTVHLPLGASEATINVGNISTPYGEGAAICFDSSFYHEVLNGGSTWRDILLLNIWHPELTEDEVTAIEWIQSKLEEFTVGASICRRHDTQTTESGYRKPA